MAHSVVWIFCCMEYWSGLPFPSPGALPHPGIEHRCPALQAEASPSEPPGKQLRLRHVIFLYKLIYLLIFFFLHLCLQIRLSHGQFPLEVMWILLLYILKILLGMCFSGGLNVFITMSWPFSSLCLILILYGFSLVKPDLGAIVCKYLSPTWFFQGYNRFRFVFCKSRN